MLRHDDSHRLRFDAYNQTFHLHLEPNDHLLHSEATMTVIGQDGLETISRLVPEEHKVYRGVVLSHDYSDQRFKEDISGVDRHFIDPRASGVLGWARVIVHDNNLFEGAFTVGMDTYHVRTVNNYLRTKQEADPLVPHPHDRHPDYASSHMIVFRDSDTASHQMLSNLQTRSLTAAAAENATSSECMSEKLDYNVDTHHPVHMMRYAQANERLHALQTSQLSKRHDSLRSGFSLDAGHGLNTFSSSLEKRQDSLGSTGGPSNGDFASQIGNFTGCPKQQMINFMGVAADCTYVQKYGDANATRVQILNDWNMASALYENSFNISLGIINIVVRDGSCPDTTDSNFPWNRNCTSDNYSINNRLSDFSQWRATQKDSAGLWHLMTNCNTGSEIGVAWLGQLCVQDASQSNGQFVSGTGVSTAGKDEWKIVAHEIGHGFGAVHDCTSTTCPASTTSQCCALSESTCDANSQFIMNPTSDVKTNDFSPCTKGNICSAMGGGATSNTCLQPVSKASNPKVLNLNQCGNGIVEAGEECDCGDNCGSNACCDMTTCKFKSGAVCDDSNDLCCNSCQFKAANTTCRPAVSSCDIAETCSGTSGSCPDDTFKPNGQDCGNGLTCASGLCTSRDQQCQQRGASLNLTQTCQIAGDSSCYNNCQDPSNPNSCIQLSAQLPDGTDCGYGGSCSSGSCVASNNILKVAESWVVQNKKISIPVLAVAGLVVIFFIVSLLYCCCGRRKDKELYEADTYATPIAPQTGRQQMAQNISRSTTPVQGVPPARGMPPGQRGWVDPTQYNGPIQPYRGPAPYRGGSPAPGQSPYRGGSPAPVQYANTRPRRRPESGESDTSARSGSSSHSRTNLLPSRPNPTPGRSLLPTLPPLPSLGYGAPSDTRSVYMNSRHGRGPSDAGYQGN